MKKRSLGVGTELERKAILLSTDLDGTLLGRGNRNIGKGFIDRILEIELERPVIWIINTGRNLRSLWDTLHSSDLIRMPDYLVERETFLHVRNGDTYSPLESWNGVAKQRVEAVERLLQPHIAQWVEKLSALYAGIEVRFDVGVPLSIKAENPQQGAAIRDLLSYWTGFSKELRVIRNGIWVALWVNGLDKGSCLTEVKHRHHVNTAQVLAVGDNDNDIPMLSSKIAGFPMTTANAEDAVKAHVQQEQGYVSPYPDVDGVLDGLQLFIGRYHTYRII